MITYSDYPKPVTQRCGAKVSWYYYRTKAEARKAAAVARKHAKQQEERGYDFGYCSPGSISKVEANNGTLGWWADHKEVAGCYEVCIP